MWWEMVDLELREQFTEVCDIGIGGVIIKLLVWLRRLA
jgi:hypothetical protein